MKIEVAVENFYLSMGGALSPKTILWYQNRLKLLVNYLGKEKELEEITLNDLRSWRSGLAKKTTRWENAPRPSKQGGYSPDSLYCFYRACKRFFKWCNSEGLIDYDPSKKLEKPKIPVRKRFGLSKENRDLIIQQAFKSSARDYVICLIFADTGCRLGGIAHLRLDDLMLTKRRAIVTEKGPNGIKQRVIYFKPFVSEALNTYLMERPCSSSEYVFLSIRKPHSPLKVNGVYEIIRRLALRAGIKTG